MVSFIVMFEQIWQGFISNIKKKKKKKKRSKFPFSAHHKPVVEQFWLESFTFYITQNKV